MDSLQLDLRILILFLLIIIFGSLLRQNEGFADKDINCESIRAEIEGSNGILSTLQSGVNDFKKRSNDLRDSVKTLRDFVGTYKCSWPEPTLDTLPEVSVDPTITPPRNGVDNFLPAGVIIVSSELKGNGITAVQNPNRPPQRMGSTLDLQNLVRSVPSIVVNAITFDEAPSTIFSDPRATLTIVLRGPKNTQYTRTFQNGQAVRFADLTDPPPPPPPAPVPAPAPAPVPAPAPAQAAAAAAVPAQAAAAAPAPAASSLPSTAPPRTGTGNFLPPGVSITVAELTAPGIPFIQTPATQPLRRIGDTRDIQALSRSIGSFIVNQNTFPDAPAALFFNPNLTLTMKLRSSQNVDYSRTFRQNEVVQFSTLTPPRPALQIVQATWGPSAGGSSINVAQTLVNLYNTGVNSVAVSKANFGQVSGFFGTLPHNLYIIFRRNLPGNIQTTQVLFLTEGRTLTFSQLL